MGYSLKALVFMGFSQEEYWSGLPFPPPGDLPRPGIEPASPALAGNGRQILYLLSHQGSPQQLRFTVKSS